MGLMPVLNKDEKFLSVKWITVCEKHFLRGSWSSSLCIKDFLTVNQRKTSFKDNLPEDGRFQAFLHHHPCPLAPVKT
jgi:hypothetical protein